MFCCHCEYLCICRADKRDLDKHCCVEATQIKILDYLALYCLFRLEEALQNFKQRSFPALLSAIVLKGNARDWTLTCIEKMWSVLNYTKAWTQASAQSLGWILAGKWFMHWSSWQTNQHEFSTDFQTVYGGLCWFMSRYISKTTAHSVYQTSK